MLIKSIGDYRLNGEIIKFNINLERLTNERHHSDLLKAPLLFY